MNLVLTGFMATGKTTVGRLAAKRLERPHYDTDAMIEKETGISIAQVFARKGEPEFRRMESDTVRLVSMLENVVISTGGGVPLRSENMAELERNGFVICLAIKPETVLERLGDDVSSRPLLAGGDPLLAVEKLLRTRAKAYGRAHATVPVDGRTPDQVTADVLSAFAAATKR